jgi:hypothetical protein
MPDLVTMLEGGVHDVLADDPVPGVVAVEGTALGGVQDSKEVGVMGGEVETREAALADDGTTSVSIVSIVCVGSSNKYILTKNSISFE